MEPFANREKIYQGTIILVEEVRRNALSAPQKLKLMQKVYLDRYPDLYSEEERKQLEYSLGTANFKFYLLAISLEHIWVLREQNEDGLFQALKNSFDRLIITDNELVVSSYLLENLLFQGVAFLDIFMLYILQLLKTGYVGSMTSPKRFFAKLELAQDGELRKKGERVLEYFQKNVFGEGQKGQMGALDPKNWGTLLRSLRDRVAHRDRVRPSFNSNERLIGNVLLDWPTLQDLTYDRFGQSIQNGMFSMLQSLSEVLYGLEWKPGPYKPDLWS